MRTVLCLIPIGEGNSVGRLFQIYVQCGNELLLFGKVVRQRGRPHQPIALDISVAVIQRSTETSAFFKIVIHFLFQNRLREQSEIKKFFKSEIIFQTESLFSRIPSKGQMRKLRSESGNFSSEILRDFAGILRRPPPFRTRRRAPHRPRSPLWP